MLYGNPFSELNNLRREMDRLFETFSGTAYPRRWRTAFLPGRGMRSYPLVNVRQDDDNVIVEALAPGVNPDSLDVSVRENVLTISGEKLPPEGVAPEQYHRSERSAGKFVRNFNLPTPIEADKVDALYKDGVLKLTLPKAAAARPRQISVKTS